MVTAHELRQRVDNADLYEILDKALILAKHGECCIDVNYINYDNKKILEQLGFKVQDYDTDEDGIIWKISW